MPCLVPIANIPDPQLDNVQYRGLIVPKVENVRFINNENCGFDLDRVNKIIDRYFQFSEFIIHYYHESTGTQRIRNVLRPFIFIPAIKRYRRKVGDVLPPGMLMVTNTNHALDMMSTGDLGIYVDLSHHIAVVDMQKLITEYPKYEQLFIKYKQLHEKKSKRFSLTRA